MPVNACTDPLFHRKVLFGESVRVELGLFTSKPGGKLKLQFLMPAEIFIHQGAEGLWIKQAICNVTFKLT